MIANTIDAAPRRPAQEITRYCPIGGFDGASSKPTAAGRATNVKNNAIAIAGSTIDGICGRFLRENTHLAGISPDYRVIEPDRSDEICERVLDKLLEELYETIEEDISVLETTIETLDQEMAENGTDYVKLRELSEKKDEAEKQLMEKMERWEYLEELAEKIANQ